jgi:putative ATP-binding cassette transporter
MLLLPQRPYVPLGTLRRAANYPGASEGFGLDDVANAFRRVGLDHLTE